MFSREELAIIENRILEKQLAAKRRAEKRAKNIAVSSQFPKKSKGEFGTLAFTISKTLR